MPVQVGRAPVVASSSDGRSGFALLVLLAMGVTLLPSAGDLVVEIGSPEGFPDLDPDHDHHLQTPGRGQVPEVNHGPPAELVPEEPGHTIPRVRVIPGDKDVVAAAG